jgi:2-dehydro-3-deoxyphosphogluconate aldolase / (4S)-4-hydroxy-2-oxoglutarate aldolase
MTKLIESTANRIKESGIIIIVRGNLSLKQIVSAAEQVASAKINIMEVTLNSHNALEAIHQLRRDLGDRMLVGAGTVRTAAQVAEAQKAGAQFIVSPNFDSESVGYSQSHEILHLPGVMTATEAQNAYMAGCRMLKLFPADTLGPQYLKSLLAPLDDIDFVPTGGITADNIVDYVRAGAAAVAVGSALIGNHSQTSEEIYAKAVQLRAAWREATHG